MLFTPWILILSGVLVKVACNSTSEVSPKSVVMVSVIRVEVLFVIAMNVPPLILLASISIIIYSIVTPKDTFIVLTLSNTVVVELAVNVT